MAWSKDRAPYESRPPDNRSTPGVHPMKISKSVVAMMLIPLVGGCGTAGRLANVGRAPKFTPQEELPAATAERSLAHPNVVDQIASSQAGHTVPQAPHTASSASLFRPGAGDLFRDQRAAAVGDIVTIRINVADRASVDNTTSRSRSGSENAGLASLFGLQTSLSKALPGNPDPSKIVDTSSASKSTGTGATQRSETINMTMAA
ncbi:MAG TPA: flagellar basal body L-ring protein FlgH, partial [Sphingomonas sp.]|nr:flagellar basal body L-ring protein FlgH [Sphingomonas sp.]